MAYCSVHGAEDVPGCVECFPEGEAPKPEEKPAPKKRRNSPGRKK